MAEDLSDVPEVRRSILNFGLRDLARLSLDEDAVHGVAKELEVALRDFEPRLAPKTIKVRRDDKVSPDELRVRFLVSADLRLQPVNVPCSLSRKSSWTMARSRSTGSER